MSPLKALRGAAVVICLAMGLLLMTASGTVASSPRLIATFVRQAGLGEEEAGLWEHFNHGGEGVALSSNGTTALIGGDNAEWVYTRSGSTWTRQAKLNSGIGSSVALSGDGNTALVGESGDNNQVGAAWVFRRTGSTWTQQGEKLTGRGEIGTGRFGTSVALSSEGKTALLGGPGDDQGVGAAWVFRRRGSTWAQRGSKLTGSDETGRGSFGHSVALSSHGNTALIGGPGDHEGIGAAWVFRRTGSTWMQRGRKLTSGNEIGQGNFGSAVALSSNGTTALIGGDTDNESPEAFSYYGAAWVFTRSGKTWTQQGKKLTGGVAYLREGGFGSSVALSSDGNTALIGDPGAPYAHFGLAWFFTRSGKTWTEEQRTEGVEGEHPGGFGTSVALSSEGNTALIGEPEAIHFWGLALVFVRVNQPTVKDVAPDRGPADGGTTVTIHGTDFTGALAVKFGSTSATSFAVDSATSITAVSPAGTTGAVDVTVTTPGGASPITSHDHFQFGRPTVTSLSLRIGYKAGGNTVTVAGSGFGLGVSATGIKFGSTPATSVNCASTTICAVVAPAHTPGTVDVTATVNEVTSAMDRPGDEFTYTEQPALPENVEPPMISGTAEEGQTLSASHGEWSGSVPVAYAFEWQRCDSAGVHCVPISLAREQTYVVVRADAGSTLRVIVTAENLAGKASSTSVVTTVVVSRPPTISGTARFGQTLTATTAWTEPSVEFAYQWERCDARGASCSSISGGTSRTYAVELTDVGSTLRVTVTAISAAREEPSTSPPTAVVTLSF